MLPLSRSPSRRGLLAAALAAPLVLTRRAGAAEPEPVDVELVLAVDVSRSIDEDEARLQREGYRAAVSDPRVVEAIRGGMMGAIAIAYTEWAGIEFQRLVLPWTRIASAREAEAWAGALAQAPSAAQTNKSETARMPASCPGTRRECNRTIAMKPRRRGAGGCGSRGCRSRGCMFWGAGPSAPEEGRRRGFSAEGGPPACVLALPGRFGHKPRSWGDFHEQHSL